MCLLQEAEATSNRDGPRRETVLDGSLPQVLDVFEGLEVGRRVAVVDVEGEAVEVGTGVIGHLEEILGHLDRTSLVNGEGLLTGLASGNGHHNEDPEL